MSTSDTPTALYRHYNKQGVLLYVGISIDSVGREAWFKNERSNASQIVG